MSDEETKENSTSPTETVETARPHVAAPHVVEHLELGFWRKYVFSTDHKMIGIQYGITGLLFLLFGFSLMGLMRWQLAYPGEAIPLLGELFGPDRMPEGIMLPEFYNQLGAICNTTPDCVAYDTQGNLYRSTGPLISWNNSDDGTFVRDDYKISLESTAL